MIMGSPQRGLSAFQYVCRRHHGGDNQSHLARLVVDHHFSESNGILFRKNLLSHYGCVNAIEFSEDGSLMASGTKPLACIMYTQIN